MRVVLFDWTSGGHHPLYVRRFVEALRPRAEVIVAAPDPVLQQLADLATESVSLGASRPLVDQRLPLGPQHRDLAERELDLLWDAAGQAEPDHVIHLYADPVIRRLVHRPQLPKPLTICVFFPRAHYPISYRTPLTPRELLRASFLEYLVRRFQARPDAHALFTLDEVAARRWSHRSGTPAFWLPEPPIAAQLAEPTTERAGCLLYGTLAPRKGIDLVTRAVSLAPTSLRIVLAGEIEPGFGEALEQGAASMQQAGASVELRLHRHSEEEGLRLMTGVQCVLLPYLNHYTASRVLLEAATVQTPVITHRRGLLGHLVRQHGLGLVVDCTDAAALREAMLQLTGESDDRYTEPLRRFAARYTADQFRQAVLAPFASERREPAGSSMSSKELARCR
ncbi:MAG: glycosyltransferase [Gaiellaceae bacterium]